MSAFQHGAGFRICGVVIRKFVAPSGKAAFLTVEVDGQRKKKLDLRAFDAEMIEEIGGLGNGQTIEVTGTVDSEKLTDKKRAPVIVDGRETWSPALTVKAITIEAASKRPSFSDDDAPISRGPAAAPVSTGGAWTDDDEKELDF